MLSSEYEKSADYLIQNIIVFFSDANEYTYIFIEQISLLTST